LFGAVVAQQLSLVLLEPSLGWLAGLPAKYVSRKVLFTTLKEAKQWPSRVFIKPADDKCFAARVYESGLALEVSEVISEDTPVLISEAVSWGIEFRFFVLDGRVRTFSCYSRSGVSLVEDGSQDPTRLETAGALKFCTRLLADSALQIPPAVAIDIGKIDGRGWAVVEANAAWASGVYQCDPRAVLEVVARACVRGEAAGPGDRQWVVERTF
jgi:hypothetical protein